MTKQKLEPKYLIMDGRAMTDIDKATVLCCAATLEEAREDAKDFGEAVIVSNESENITEKDIIEYINN